ncbi:type III pantothenate kinase [Sediminicola luteus]|uniref:Type III pantothenate kinase n=1 Tax=Sediminicola luteus TaxID=319238 RepID=A0A2A4GBB1_9FLAO|nr:type III pantothenate kinase [Sediminicola luteus]PCE65887.1 pantothenate kinase [Sediminicola luteus]
MKLIIDVGNTRIKWAIYQNNDQITKHIVARDSVLLALEGLFETYPNIQAAMLCCVGQMPEGLETALRNRVALTVFGIDTPIPIQLDYKTPSTLGVDRLAVAVGAYFYNPSGNTLVIDAGSCVTYDLLTEDGKYLGGAISPGIQMRYKAMHNQTAGLPLLAPKSPKDLVGKNTEEAMHSGVIHGLACELDGVVTQYHQRFQSLTVILTGGDAHFLSKRLKNTIFAHSDFLLWGLYRLLEHN